MGKKIQKNEDIRRKDDKTEEITFENVEKPLIHGIFSHYRRKLENAD